MISHPQIVHFPIALLTVAVIADLISYFWQKEFFNKMALTLLLVGVLTAFFAVQSGDTAMENLNNIKPIKYLLDQHESAGEAVLKLFGLALILKAVLLYLKKEQLYIKILISIVMLMGVFKIYQAGHLGGILVYEKGVGVQQLFEETKTP
ncbi:MAG: hypothetical protein D8M58_15735 [Calditrichaeota bacterium]|nr:MAG: hypothetical protein DWQ03_07465 [Calditrichota bacterium]MBL1206856.1 hypothetical protein [Calditrichota bacterium]NOG46683.1 hypothetical protein [Calditrichota bacterium]